MAFKKLKKKLQESKIEKAQIAAANQQIRKKVVAASLQERERQELKLAIEKEKLRAGKKLESVKSGGFGGKVVRFLEKAQARQSSARRTPIRRAVKRISVPIKRRAKKKGKTIKRKASRRVTRRTAPRRTAPPQQAFLLQASPSYSSFDMANLVR